MVPEFAIPEEEPVDVHIHKLAIGVHDTRTEMAQVQLELNLLIIELQLRAQASTPPEVKEQRVAAVIEAVTEVESAVPDCTHLFEQSFEVLIGLQEDPNIQRLETEARELQQHYDEVKGTMRTVVLTQRLAKW